MSAGTTENEVKLSGSGSASDDLEKLGPVYRLMCEKDTWRPFGHQKPFCGNKIIIGPVRTWWWLLEIYTIAVTVVFFVEHEKYGTIVIPIVGGICFLICMISSFKALFCDPGIVIRPSFDEALQNARNVETMIKSGLPYPTKRVELHGEIVTYRYCIECHLFRPPGSSHCSRCDCCVEESDHHCPVIGVCVGKRNLFAFHVMAISISLYHFFLFVTGLYLLIRWSGNKLDRTDVTNSGPKYVWEVSITLDCTVIGIILAFILPLILVQCPFEKPPPKRRSFNPWAYRRTLAMATGQNINQNVNTSGTETSVYVDINGN